MSTHHPRQVALAVCLESIREKVAKFSATRASVAEMSEAAASAESALVSAQSALSSAAADKATSATTTAEADLKAARKALAAAGPAHEEAKLILKGGQSALAAAQAEMDALEFRTGTLAAEVCQLLAADVESDAIELSRQLGQRLALRRQLANMARTQASLDGMLREPINGASGEVCEFSRIVNENLEKRAETALTVPWLLDQRIAD